MKFVMSTMIVAVVRSDVTRPHLLRQYACDALGKEFLDTPMPGNKRIEIAGTSLVSLRDKLISISGGYLRNHS